MWKVLSRARSLWRGVRRRSALESEMDEEFRLHMELRAEDLVRSGLPAAEARRRARLEFGGVERYKEEARASRGLRLLDELRGDLRYAARSLRKSPGFAAAAVLTLALGVGANTAVFSLVSASLLRPLPFDEAERIVVLQQTYGEPGSEPRDFRWWSPPQFAALEARLTTLTELAAYWVTDVNLAGGDAEPVRVRMELASPAYFPALRVRPVIGRGFLPEEDSMPGAHPVAVLGHDLWESHFGADPRIVGERILLNGVPLTVVGVAPAGFGGLTGEAELWMPHAMAPAVHMPGYLASDQYFLGVIGRPGPGISIEQARAEVAATGARVAAEVRAAGGGESFGDGAWTAGLQPLEQARRNPAAVRAQLVLAGAVFFVLLIAVVNLSGLLLARSTARARETAARAALGAGRLRLVRQGVVEGGLLGVLGGAVGVLLAIWSVRALVALAPEGWGAPRLSVAGLTSFARPEVDWRVIGFGAAVALAAGVLAGLVPALRSTRGDLTRALKAGGRGSSAGVGTLRRPTLLSTAAMLQVACALVLLVGAGLLLQGFHRLSSVDPGFEPGGLVTFAIALPGNQYGGEAGVPLLQRVLERVEAVPGVRSASVGCAPFGGCWSTSIAVEGRPIPDRAPSVRLHSVSPDHFRTLGIPLVRGRALTAEDRRGRPDVAVINETAAKRFWPGEDPIGARVWLGFGAAPAALDSATEIVGVVGDVLNSPPGQEVRPSVYTSYLQWGRAPGMVIVRTAADPTSLVPAFRRAVAAVDPNLPIHDVRTMRERGAEALAVERFSTAALGIFAGLGLLLASLGIYGIMAYSVAQRRREIGIRLALGAAPANVLRFVIRQGLGLVAVGVAFGGAVSLVVARVLPALIADVGAAHPVVFAAVVPILLGVGLLACYFPARSATRVNPGRDHRRRVTDGSTPMKRFRLAVAGLVVLLAPWALRPQAPSPESGTPRVVRAGEMTVPRAAHQATLLPNGAVLITGGCVDAGCERIVASAELYDPATRAFRPVGPMATPRASHEAVPLRDGRVLVTGGWNGSSGTRTPRSTTRQRNAGPRRARCSRPASATTRRRSPTAACSSWVATTRLRPRSSIPPRPRSRRWGRCARTAEPTC